MEFAVLVTKWASQGDLLIPTRFILTISVKGRSIVVAVAVE